MKGISVPNLGKLIIECWAAAEQSMRTHVKTNLGDRHEESITELFHEKLDGEFKRVSTSGAVAKVFLSDLKHAFPWAPEESLS